MAQDMDKLQSEAPPNTRVVCLSFERFNEGSDADGGFAKGKFFSGDMYRVPQAEVYAPLFGRKGLLQGFGLGSLMSDKSGRLAESSKRGVTGNLAGDGMQLGGLFVVSSSGEVLLDRRQKFFGDDASNEEILAVIAQHMQSGASASASASASAAGGAAGGGGAGP
jgi:hypothetical protein